MKLLNKTQSDRSILTKSFLKRMVQMRSCFLTTCTNKVHEDKNTKQMSHYAQEKGRSMVEMLGVLAIIGVLSVGGIAGYSKAMFKYKMNQTLDTLSQVVARIVELKESGAFNRGGIGFEELPKLGFECEYDDGICILPTGYYSTDGLGETQGDIQILLNENAIDMCTAFFTSEMYKTVPDDWLTFIDINAPTNPAWYSLYSNNKDLIEQGYKSELKASDIASACSLCKNEINECAIRWRLW